MPYKKKENGLHKKKRKRANTGARRGGTCRVRRRSKHPPPIGGFRRKVRAVRRLRNYRRPPSSVRAVTSGQTFRSANRRYYPDRSFRYRHGYNFEYWPYSDSTTVGRYGSHTVAAVPFTCNATIFRAGNSRRSCAPVSRPNRKTCFRHRSELPLPFASRFRARPHDSFERIPTARTDASFLPTVRTRTEYVLVRDKFERFLT